MKIKKNKNEKIIYFKFILSTVILIFFSIININFIFNLLKLNDIENLIRYVICGFMIIINILFILLYYLYYPKKKRNIKLNIILVIMVILSLIAGFINFNFEKMFNVLDNITENTQEYTLSLVTLSDNSVEHISDIDDDIAVIQDENIENGYKFALEIIEKNDIKHDLIKYETYLDIVSDLYSSKIKYAFLPDNYVNMFSLDEEYKDIGTKLKIIHNDSKKVEIVSVNKDINKPFSILLMGVDTLNSSYNADTLLLITFNPETLGTTMLSIPRDTYTTIACTGGKHKINSSGWYSDKCVVDTVSNLVDIDIDYYAKINFVGVVDLVNDLGGIDVDVVYPFCEQDSKRNFSNMIYVDEGLQHLNGEQALALTRNRNYWYGMCPDKYNQKGYYSYNLRNDITRGMNQQLVLKAILNSLSQIKDLNTIYDLFDTVGNNVSTNMDKDTILSFYNIFKNIVMTSDLSNIENIFDIQKLSFEVYGTYIHISGLNLSMIIPHQNSINVVSNAMKENLDLKKKDVIKNLSFDINNPYEEEVIGKGIYGGTVLNLLEDLTGKTYTDALSYCNKINFECEFEYVEIDDGSYENNQIISQNPPGNYDISLIRNKIITFNVAKVIKNNTFDYSLCTTKEYEKNNKCIVPDFTNKKISDFNSWYKNFSFIKVNLTDVNDEDKENGLIISQSISDKSIYELYNDNDSIIEITYIKNSNSDNKENTNDNTDNNENNNDTDNDKTENTDNTSDDNKENTNDDNEQSSDDTNNNE